MYAIKKLTGKTVLIIALCFVLVFTQTVQKAHAFIPVVIGGLAIGEALFYTAAAAATGYTLYEAYDSFKSDSLTVKFIQTSGKKLWTNMTQSMKDAWAAAESTINPAVASSVELSQELWNQALVFGSALFATDRTITPAIPMPSDRYNASGVPYITETNDFMVKFATLMFTMNGEEFALMPFTVVKGSTLEYRWYHKNTDGTWTSDIIPSAASAFGAPKIVITTGATADNVSVTWQSYGTRIKAFNYQVTDWDRALMTALDSLPAMQSYLETVYGGLSVSVPAQWVPTIPQEKDTTKPVAIPIPAGTITYPTTGEGTLSLDMDQVKVSIGEMVGAEDPTAPGEETPPKGDWPDTLKGIVTTRFPFSLPWDLYAMFSLLNASPKAPEINVDTKFGQMPLKMQYKFDWLDPYIPWFRGIIIVGFCIYLIQITRNLLGGAK